MDLPYLISICSLFYLLPSLVSTSCPSSSSAFSFNADPYHVDVLPVVDCHQSFDSSFPHPLPHDVILDSHHRPQFAASSDSTSSSASKSHEEWIPGNHFHRLDPGKVILRAQSGPFEASARVLDAEEDGIVLEDDSKATESSSSPPSSSVHVTAHPVAHALRRDEPVVRVLFHATNRRRPSCYDYLGQSDECRFDQQVCVVGQALRAADEVAQDNDWLHGSTTNDHASLVGSCVIESGARLSTGCLMQIVIPTNWWLSGRSRSRTMNEGVDVIAEEFVSLHYRAFYVDDAQSCVGKMVVDRKAMENQPEKIHHQGLTPGPHGLQHQSQPDLLISDILRMPMTASDADGTAASPETNNAIQPRAPMDKVHRGTIMHIPVTVDVEAALEGATLEEFVVKAKVKRGLKILGAEISVEGDRLWRTSVRSRSRSGASITISASRRSRRSLWNRPSKRDRSTSSADRRVVLATVVFKGIEEKEFFDDDQVRVTWTIEFGGGSKRNTSQTVFRASRESVQALVPVIKTGRLLNTALVDGNAVVEPMRVYAVSFTGVIQDISAKATCHSQSRDSLKVSSSCENVYLDGSETHGFSEVTILAKYMQYLGYTTIAVWVPRLPMQIVISDRKLSQVRGWKVPREDIDNNGMSRQKQSSKNSCSLKYQEATIRILARFLTDGAAISTAGDDNKNAKWLLGDGVSVDVTWRVKTDIRLVSPELATIKKMDKERRLVLVGKSPGFTMIQVVSPFTGRVLASSDVEVTAFDRVDLIGTHVSVLTGLNLFARRETLQHSSSSTLSASLTAFRRFHAVGHIGVLDIQLIFSDGTKFPLNAVSPKDYTLVVNSLATDVVAISTTPSLSSSSRSSASSMKSFPSHVPTLVATGEGSGDFVYVSLDSPESCVGKRKQLSESVKDLVLSPSLTSDYVPITVGDGLTTEYDLSYSDDWMGGGGSDEFDGFLNDGSFNAYADHWGVPLGLDPSVKESSVGDPSGGRSYAYQEFSKLGAVKESRNRKKLFSEGKGLGVKREETFSPFRDYDFDRWESKNIQDPQDLFLPGVSEKRAAAPAEQSITKTEIALYVLLAVLAIAVAVLAAHCAVHHVKRKRVVRVKLGHTSRRTATPNAVTSACEDDDSATEDASEDFACADDFVWMSKEALEEAEIPVECTQRLMPEADFVAQTLQRDLPPHHPGQPSAIASLSRGNSRSSYTAGRLGTHGSLPIAGHHRGSLPECHHRSRASSVASSGSRMSHQSATSAASGEAVASAHSRRHHSDSSAGIGDHSASIGDDEAFDVSFRSSGSTPTGNGASSADISGTTSPGAAFVAAAPPINSGFISSAMIGSRDADSMRSSRSGASSLLSVTLNPIGELQLVSTSREYDQDSVDGTTIIPSSSSASASRCPMESSAASSRGASSPLKSSVSTSMNKRYSHAMSSSPPSSPRLTGSPPGSPHLGRSYHRLLKQDSITSTNSKVLGSICYDYRDRGLSFDQMVQYFDNLGETPT